MKKSKFTKHTRNYTRKRAKRNTGKHNRKHKNKRRSVRKFGGYEGLNSPYNNVLPELKRYIDQMVDGDPQGETIKQKLLDNLHNMPYFEHHDFLYPREGGNTPYNQGMDHIDIYFKNDFGWWQYS